MRHLVHMASHSAQTNMHARNLAIVWAPNLLRWACVHALVLQVPWDDGQGKDSGLSGVIQGGHPGGLHGGDVVGIGRWMTDIPTGPRT